MSTNLALATGSSLVQMHHDHKYPPILLNGPLEPVDLHIWEQAMNHYFTKVKIIKMEKVTNVCTSFRSLGVMNWIDSSRDMMTANNYTFAAFMTELCKQFLESGWAKKLYHSKIKRTMLPNQHFVDYANYVIYYNIILKGTANHSDNAKL